ncbi:MAG: hypothetical protein COZ20_04205 [Gallionellales bacterium CG_4_10_14_3_um_filter_54_96]|nr:MAG: hypothetical protein COS43_06015 [Gallionellales bacterium CG03_land_8_20_14_0_80_55_15]PIV91614.1 MAG: hypothetical protein COW45_04535 [Gallionellales bacterium CG17_big_fil_post_rev_8_21_14_2_50_54_146]PIX04325.1 MAG: hypothetical protein COZ77_07065 [Gallionellales bacterium CG_4_8_14_3_um_filter_54_18]PIY05040.1 MAG: hypothetical protein COZ20_04205 [Gallionellales bacterium CG_4_10_14_3_um_filter_54_96]HCJ51167.1 hypothetical protein [Gallionella sp.]
MALPDQQPSLPAYLEWGNKQPERHEFYRDKVFAMTDCRRLHGCVTANLVMHLGNQLAGTPCQVFPNP